MQNPYSEEVRYWENMLKIWLSVMSIFIVGLAIWAIFYVSDIKYQVQVFAIIGAMIVVNVSANYH